MKKSLSYFTSKYLSGNAGSDAVFKEYLDDAGNVLGHCFLPAVINYPLEKLLRKNIDIGRIKHYVSFLQRIFDTGDDSVKNIVEVSIIEYFALGEMETLEKLYQYLSPELLQWAKDIRRFWGPG